MTFDEIGQTMKQLRERSAAREIGRDAAQSIASRFQGFDCVVWFRHAGAGAPREILISIGKPGSQLEAMARETSILFNAARAFGVSFETLHACAAREPDGSPATIFAHALDLVSHEMNRGVTS